MSSRSPQSRRTYAGSRSWSLDHHQRPMHVLRSRCHGSVPFDPASPLGKERMVRAVPRDRAGSLAATIADFCNKIGTKRTFETPAVCPLLGGKADFTGPVSSTNVYRLALRTFGNLSHSGTDANRSVRKSTKVRIFAESRGLCG